MNAFVLIVPIVIILIAGQLLVGPYKGEPRTIFYQAPQVSAAAIRERQRQEQTRQAMREELVRPAD